MPRNSYFQFKQFRVEQGQCAMKVCTDACIFGAWAGAPQPNKILDIGAGTGLLSLMLAQRHHCPIEAVEIDRAAFRQCAENFAGSPFSARLSVQHLPIQEFAKLAGQSYDLIVSNPPFFDNHLLAQKENENKARHTGTLSFEELVASVGSLLTPKGKFQVLLPEYEYGLLRALAEKHGLYEQHRLEIFNKANSPIFRVASTLSFQQGHAPKRDSLLIRDSHGAYSPEFIELLEDYYLYL